MVRKLLISAVVMVGLFVPVVLDAGSMTEEVDVNHNHSSVEDVVDLEEIEIIASRILQRADGYSVNLKDFGHSAGKQADELLRLLPNVSVEEGVYKINGIEVSEIMIDDISVKNTEEISAMPASMIERVDITSLAEHGDKKSSPGGTVRIFLRKPPQGGYYGYVNISSEWQRACGFGDASSTAMINGRYKRLGVYDNFRIGHYKYKSDVKQTQIAGGEFSSSGIDTDTRRNTISNRLSLTYEISDGTRLGVTYYISSDNPRIFSSSTGDASDDFSNRKNVLEQEATLNLTSSMESDNRSYLEATVDFYSRRENQNILYSGLSTADTRMSDHSLTNLWKGVVNYNRIFSDVLNFSAGASFNYISGNVDQSILDSRDGMSDSRELTGYANSRTTGITPIVYASVDGRVWKIMYNAGLDWQMNRIEYQAGTDTGKSTKVSQQLNPSLQVVMPFGRKMNHMVMLQFKRMLNDIPYSAISSAEEWIDANNYTIGNPELVAPSSEFVMAGVSLFNNKLSFAAMYANSRNAIFWNMFKDESVGNLFYTKPVNMKPQSVFGINAEWNETPFPFWRFKLAARLECHVESQTLRDVKYDDIRPRGYFSFVNSFVFCNGWSASLNCIYEPTYRHFEQTYHKVYSLSGSVSKSFWNERFLAGLRFSPLGNRRRIDYEIGGEQVGWNQVSPTEYVGLSLTWNFSGGKRVNSSLVDGIQNYIKTSDVR